MERRARAAYKTGVPAYQFYSLPRTEASAPMEQAFYNDRVALSWGLRSGGENGVEVWQGSRFIGRVHGRVAEGPDPDD